MTETLKIKLRNGAREIEIEGTRADVDAILERWWTDVATSTTSDGARDSDSRSGAKKKAAPSCGSRILELKDEGYFSELRSPGDIKEKLSEKGHNYAPNLISASLIILAKKRDLRRVKTDGAWKYQNP